MKDLLLNTFAAEDIEDILGQIELSFNIRFYENEFAQVTNFGELCKAITKKIDLENFDDCTNQQAFYKLRRAIATIKQVDEKEISPETNLSTLFLRRNRRKEITKLENKLGIKFNILSPPAWVSGTFVVLLLASFVLLFFNWKIGVPGIILFAGCLSVAKDLGKELQVKTIGELTIKMTRENYVNSRRNKNSYNKNEVNQLLLDWFKEGLSVDMKFEKQATSFS